MSAQKGKTGQQSGRLRYAEWMAAILPKDESEGPTTISEEDEDEISRRVRAAMEKLGEFEVWVVERVHLMGDTSALAAREAGCSVTKVERGLRSARHKLRAELAEFVRKRFRIEVPARRFCPVCDSVDRDRAEEIVNTKKPEETWKRVMDELNDIGVAILAPQALIGHVKYHSQEWREKKHDE